MSRLRARFLRRLRRDDRGLAAIEFALIAPVMIVIYFGVVELCQGFLATKRTGHAASMVADLVSQSAEVTPAQLNDMFGIGALIMRPYPSAPLKVRVASVTRDNLGVARVDWIQGDPIRNKPLTKGATVTTIPDGIIENGESLIMAETTYDYDSPFGVIPGDLTHFSHSYYLRPRIVDKVVCKGCP
jgi:Flp pilus assembly pilin Flp